MQALECSRYQQQQSYTPSTDVPSKINPTIVRVRGELAHNPQLFTADLDYAGAIGFCIVLTDAAAAGIADGTSVEGV